MSRKSSSPSWFLTLADQFAVKLVRDYTTEGHTNRTSYISNLPVMKAAIQAHGMKHAVPLQAISQKKRRLHEDVGVPDAGQLVSQSSHAASRYNPRAGQVVSTQGILRSSAGRGAVASSQRLPSEILATVFDFAINSEFSNLLDELTQRNADAYRPPVLPSVLSAVCKQWNSILMCKPSMWRRISFSLSENDDLCDIPDDYSSSLKLTWQYRYLQRAKTLPLDIIIHRWSSTESNYITNLFNSLFCVPLDTRIQPGQPPRTTNLIRSIVITSAGGIITTGAHIEPWPLRYCAPNVSLVSFGRQDWASLKPLLCSAQTLELYQSATLPYQGCLAQTEHLFMEFTDDPCEEILPSHAVQYIIENAPKLQSLAVGYTTSGSLLPRGQGDAFVHPTLEYLQISPNDLGVALSPFEYGLSAPNVSRVTLLELPFESTTNTTMVAIRHQYQRRYRHPTRHRHTRGSGYGRQLARAPRPICWRNAPRRPPDSEYGRRPLCAAPHRPVRLVQAPATACEPYRNDTAERKCIFHRSKNSPRPIAARQGGHCVDFCRCTSRYL